MTKLDIESKNLKGLKNVCLAPFLPTPKSVIKEALKFGEISYCDVFFDLGCGDGRTLVLAAQEYGIKCVGIEADKGRYLRSLENVKINEVDHLVEVRNENIYETDLSEATIAYMYLTDSSNVILRPYLTTNLRKGSKIISHNYSMGAWLPTRQKIITHLCEQHKIFVYQL